VKRTLIALMVLFACHRLYAPVGPPPMGSLNVPVISGGLVIISGTTSFVAISPAWHLEQSPDLISWSLSPQQPSFTSTNFSCTNDFVPPQLYYRLSYY
jgi:hypothetical protein